MLVTLKIIHFFCLFGGGAAGIGNALLLTRSLASGKPPTPIVAQTMKTLGMIGLSSIVLLWLTGIGMVVFGPGSFALGWQFYVKLVAAAVVLACVVAMTTIAARAAAADLPPDGDRMITLSRLSSLGAVVAVIFAVLAFS